MTRSWNVACVLAACSLPALPGCGSLGWSEPSQARRPSPTPAVATATPPAPAAAPANTAPMTIAEASEQAAPATLPTESNPTEAPGTTNIARVTFAEVGQDFDPSVSPDGTRLAFASTQHRTTSDIYVKRTDSRVVTQLTNDPAEDAMPAFSPDGTRIAFASNRTGNWDIFVMPASGGKAVQITDDPGDDIHPSWSPDGRRLVFSRMSESSRRWEMWTSEIANPTVSNFIGYGLFPKWCPVAHTGEGGADRILFQQPRERGGRTFGVWTLDLLDGRATNTTEIVGGTTTAMINPSWSPDGQWIVYAEIPGTDPRGVAQRTARPTSGTLWMVSAEGEGRMRLTSGRGVSRGPVWGPDGRLFYVSDRSGTDNIWSMDLSPAMATARAMMEPGGTNTTANGTTTWNNTRPQANSPARADNNPVAAAGEDEPAPRR